MYDVFLSVKVVLILANSADPDEMQHNAAFHLGLHCLPEYLVSGFSIQWVITGFLDLQPGKAQTNLLSSSLARFLKFQT